MVYAAMLVYGAALVLIGPAESALFAALFPLEVRRHVNGFRLALQEGAKVVAPVAGTALFVLLGGGAVAVLDAATFALAAGALLCLRMSDPRPVRSGVGFRRELGAGFAFIRGRPTCGPPGPPSPWRCSSPASPPRRSTAWSTGSAVRRASWEC